MVNGYVAASLAEALKIRNEEQVIPYGGGTDLMIHPQQEKPYLFLHKVKEMRQITEDEKYIRIGASCTFTEVIASELVPQLLKEAVTRIAAPAIRNVGTMGGNIGNGSAKADTVLIEFVTDAKIVLASAAGERVVEIADFYKGRKQLDLAENELIREILIPKHGLENYGYQKVGARNALAISRVSFAGVIEMEGEIIKHIAVAFGSIEDTVTRHKELEKMLEGKTLEEAKQVKEEFLAAYDNAIHPIRGRVSSEYRKTVCMNLLKEFLDAKGI